MPPIGTNGALTARLPPPPKPAPVATPSPPKVSTKASPAPAPAFHDAGTAGNYGGSAITAYKASPNYKNAVISVFKAQPPEQQQTILRGALKTPTAEGKMVLDYAHKSGNLPMSSIVPPLAAVENPVGGVPGFVKATGFVDKLITNAGKDAISLPAEALSSVASNYKAINDLFGGNSKGLGELYNTNVAPYVQLAEHPVKSFVQHPLSSALMASAPLSVLGRLGAAPIRALAPEESALGKAVSTQREGVHLTGKLTKEQPAYSPVPHIKAAQATLDKAKYTRNGFGELVPRNEGARVRGIKQGVGELVGVQERIRRVNRTETRNARESAIQPPVAARAAQTAKTTLAYNPKQAEIPGAAVLSRIADTTIRRPDTYTADLNTHIAQVSANRPNLLDEPKMLKAHDQYVKALKAEAAKNRTPAQLDQAFKAAEAYHNEYGLTQAQAKGTGHYGSMTDEDLQARELSHFASTHMGAKMTDQGLVDSSGEPLSNTKIIAAINDPKEGTGGRMPAYTPDRVRINPAKEARAANYVSQARRPLPNVSKNTLYAYTHGLTEPGHAALTEQHTLLQGVVDAHRAQNAYLETLATQKAGGGYWNGYQAAKRDAPAGYAPINVSEIFHPQNALDQALADAHPATIEEEAVRRSLDLNARLQPGTKGRWAIIDEQALKALRAHESQIQPNAFLRTARGLNTQFRTVALATSPKHIPGIIQENLIRAIAHGIGLRSWITGRRILNRAEAINPVEGKQVRTRLTGGQVAGMTEASSVYHVSDHWQGTNLHPFLKSYEAMMRAPGPRQARTLWRHWTSFVLGTTKHLIEQQSQIAGVGKIALREHGYTEAAKIDGFMGLMKRGMGLHGQMLEDATRGVFDPAKQRQLRSTVNQMYGKWTDLTPSAQTALMFSPFGLWWANSVKFLARMPVDMPIKTGQLAATSLGSQKQRQAEGLDLFGPNALPAYEQGGIPVGGKILAQNYYSPFGVANDPLATGQSLIQPWLTPAVLGSVGVNWLGSPLSSPNNPKGYKKSSTAQRIQYILDSALSSFVPLYTKAQTIAAGGASAYDVSNSGALPSFPPTKGSGSLGAGIKKALIPVREYAASRGKASGGGSWNFTGGGSSSSSSSSSGGWNFGGGSSSGSSSSSGWNFGG